MSSEARAPRCWAIIPAAGSGQRMTTAARWVQQASGQQPLPKQYLTLAGATVLEHALRPFLDHPQIAGVVVVLAENDLHWQTLAAARHPAILRATGGAERMHSVLNGLQALRGRAQPEDWVLVHDAARPCLTQSELRQLILALQADPVGGLLALPLSDTLKRSDANATAVLETLERRNLWRAQTPQMFRYAALHQALSVALTSEVVVTDEAAAIEALGLAPKLIQGASTNIKVTRPTDLVLAQAILNQRSSAEGANGGRQMMQRTGSGYDVHAFCPGDFVMLGGVRIPHTQGVRAHSDGDVVIHALCDALLGAAALGDIGQHFPDSEARWRGAASSVFLRHVMQLLSEHGYRVGNIDLTVLAERPRLSAHRAAIRQTLAQLMDVPVDAVNIKATTAEGLGAIGRGEGLAAQATATLIALTASVSTTA